MNDLLLVFYGDDLTGSTDSLEALVRGGVPSVLFMEPPTSDQLAAFPGVRAVGLAGLSRTMTPEQMSAALPQVFQSLQVLGAPILHYKVCSTFDSSPEVGSIGRATEIGREVTGTSLVPVMVGAPKLRRYVVFGNHFATAGSFTYRLDRHPTMSRHPITPMDESDLRLHLRRQTDLLIGNLDVHQLEGPFGDVADRIAQMRGEGVQVVILDTLDETHQLRIGRLLWRMSEESSTFVAGSSGVEFALVDYWHQAGIVDPPAKFSSPGSVDQIAAISGSASPHTAEQLRYAFQHGFFDIRLDSAALVDPGQSESARSQAVGQALDAIASGKSVILYSTLGPDDPEITRTRERMHNMGLDPGEAGAILGRQQGLILKEIVSQTGLKRVAVAGGDTSSNVYRQLGVYVIEFLLPLGVATPLCRAKSHFKEFDGLEIALKGGQLGEVDFFSRVLEGRGDSSVMT